MNGTDERSGPPQGWTSFAVDSLSPEQTEAIGTVFGRFLLGGEVVGLVGDLGAGKTCLVRGMAVGLGIEPSEIASPTYVICQEHRGRRLDLLHVDAYRLRGPEELDSIGWEEWRRGSDRVVVIEWPQRIEHVLPEERLELHLEHSGPLERRLELRGPVAQVAAWRRQVLADRCRSCGRPVLPGAVTAPFCSERCRLIDLGRWAEQE